LGRTVSYASGYAPADDEFDPLTDDFVSRERKYVHFDLGLSERQRTEVRATPSAIMASDFWPLLAFSKTERRVKRDKSGTLEFSDKVREIKFGSHYDSAILEHYASGLARSYERFLKDKSFAFSVLAYRRGMGSNIQHAKSLFDEIKSRGELIAIAVDISGFFDHIRHSVLLDNLSAVLAVDRIPEADFKVFTRMTKFEWVDVDNLEERLAGKRRPPGRLCDAYQFRKYVRKKGESIIEKNSKFFGIPQGTPLSGLYANISLLQFDAKLHEHFKALGGSVRRYSDDIAVLIPKEGNSNTAIAFIRDKLAEIGLTLSEHKTEIARFSNGPVVGQISSDKPFQYLGFTFDGKNTLIRQSSLNRYYSKMRSGVHAKVLAAKHNNVPASEIYMRELFRKYTHFGKHRNFPRYAYRAAKDMNAPEIRKQLSNHFNLFKEMVKVSIASIY
jgi:RNA-directed DNA polymerase